MLHILLLLTVGLFAQKSLRVSFVRFGNPKVREVFVGERLEYKLKGTRRFKMGTISNLNDSLIVLASEKTITLSSLKAIRIRKNLYHRKLFKTIFLSGAFGYPAIVGLNYLIVPDSQGFTTGTAIVSGSFFLAAGIMNELNIYRVRITKRKKVSVFSRDFQHLNDSLPTK